jgi:hypothetical protein
VVTSRSGPLATGRRRSGSLEAIVDETGNPLAAERTWVAVRVHRVVRQRVAADRVQDASGVVGHDLHVTVEQNPIAGLRLIAIAERVPAVVALGILEDRHHVG